MAELCVNKTVPDNYNGNDIICNQQLIITQCVRVCLVGGPQLTRCGMTAATNSRQRLAKLHYHHHYHTGRLQEVIEPPVRGRNFVHASMKITLYTVPHCHNLG